MVALILGIKDIFKGFVPKNRGFIELKERIDMKNLALTALLALTYSFVSFAQDKNGKGGNLNKVSPAETAIPNGYAYELKDSSHFIGILRQPLQQGYEDGKIAVSEYEYTEFNTEISKELEEYLLQRKPISFTGIEKHKRISFMSYSKIVRTRDGKLKTIRPKTFELTNLTAKRSTNRSRAYAASSVMAPGSGKWYKIGVKNTGVYKIDYNFLVSMGINPDTLNPQHINIYGNSAGMLDEAPGPNAPDDLYKNAIYIQGEGDGQFNSGDFIVFYGKSAYNWYYNTTHKMFMHENNYFSDSSFYFINISASNTPKRVQTITNSSTPNFTSTSFDDYTFHEVDSKNFIKSGRNWVGEEFDIIDTRDFTISFNSLKTDERVKFYGKYTAYTAGVSNQSDFDLSLPDGGINRTITIPGIFVSTYNDACVAQVDTFSFYSSSSSMTMNLTFNKFAIDSKGWLDFYILNGRSNYTLLPGRGALNFRDRRTVSSGRISQFNLTSLTSDTHIWNVTDPSNAFYVNPSISGSTHSFVQNTDSLLEFVAFSFSGLPSPAFVREVPNQNLHALSNVPYIIVVHPEFYEQALTLSSLHAAKGMLNHVVTTEQVYNEFSSGMVDAAGIRNFMKMFYDRAAGDPSSEPKYLLLFGDGSYDNKAVLGIRQNFIPTHQSIESYNLISSYTSDDYFGLLDNNELTSIGSSLLDIGIGRLTVKSDQEATDMVEKIKSYMTNSYVETTESCCETSESGTMGTWRNKVVLIADDEDGAAYVGNCEDFYDKIKDQANDLEVKKIYLDATTQTSTPGGQRYFEAEALLKESVQNGALIVNYVGHGGEVGWAAERLLDVATIKGWSNHPKYPIFVTATCEFSRYDDPFRTSAGEYVLLNSRGGAIAMLTTTRLVFASSNFDLNNAFYDHVFDLVNDEPKHFGEVIMATKNDVPGTNSRNFCLLGDPAIQIKLPFYKMKIDSINGVAIGAFLDTLKALSVVRMSGHIEDNLGNIVPDFNGIAYPKVYDKIKSLYTLGQDINSNVVNFKEWKNLLFQGRSTVADGRFKFSFIIPKDINQTVDTGRFVGYANDMTIDGKGFSENFVVGSVNLNATLDNKGPEIEVFLNDKSFANGGTTNTSPFVMVDLTDESGINTVGTGIGHDITLTIDNQTAKTIILNDKYQADKDSYQSGKIKYQLEDLTVGEHVLKVKAFDVYNNSAEQEIKFTVTESSEMVLNHVFNYPNPFTTSTEFMFEHNQSCSSLDVQVQVFTISGKLVRTINETVNNEGFRVSKIMWDGKDDFGDKLARGTYIYRIKAQANSLSAEKIERLVILY